MQHPKNVQTTACTLKGQVKVAFEDLWSYYKPQFGEDAMLDLTLFLQSFSFPTPYMTMEIASPHIQHS